MLLEILIGVGIGLLTSALVISCYELTTSLIRNRVKQELPEATYVEIEKTLEKKGKTVLPVYKAKAYNRNHNKIKDIDFEYTKSAYFYNGEKIVI